MDTLLHILKMAALILVVLLCFNIIIFVHELGHFLAGKWRGLKIDRFQIWFGKPIWKKEINGVQYGLGWIPAGGFVALPQMAPMESIEGGNKSGETLPPITPLDKIIVAFAGPLFSLLLALFAAVLVWFAGKPADVVRTKEIGYVEPGGPAAQAGLLPGDIVEAINGKPVRGFQGTLDSIQESIILSRGKEIAYTIRRPGIAEPITFKSGFTIEKTSFFRRKALREVGLEPATPAVVGHVFPNSPADKAGLKVDETITAFDGTPLRSPLQLSRYLRDNGWKTVALTVQSPGGSTRDVSLTPESPLKPDQPKKLDPMVGVGWNLSRDVDVHIVRPNPFQQVSDSLRMMWVTITSVIAPDSNISIDHLSGPVGIVNMKLKLLQTDDGWRRILAFMVLFNVNLAVLNMLPFPVLDGGHITLALLEKIAGRPVKAKILEVVQTGFALALISLMLYVSSKDISDFFPGRKKEAQEIIFAQ